MLPPHLKTDDRYVVTIGVFDGVHLGHVGMLEAARRTARQMRARVLALAFDPHPAHVLRPDQVPSRLLTWTDKAAFLREAGADDVCRVEPTPSLLGQAPEQFVENLVSARRVRAVVEGPDFRFGQGRRGDADMLRRLGANLGFEACVVEPVQLALHDQLVVTVRSSLVRWLLAHGRVADAARCLGRCYQWQGVVERGEGRGRSIGVPTANVRAVGPDAPMTPAEGVYAATAILKDGRAFPAAISVGSKPTFAATATLVVEAHLIGFAGELYGEPLKLQFQRWLRDQIRFDAVEPLQAQIGRDVRAVQRWHGRDAINGLPCPAAAG